MGAVDHEGEATGPDYSWRPPHWGGSKPDRTFDEAMDRYNRAMAKALVDAMEEGLLPEWWWDEECLGASAAAGHDVETQQAAGLRHWVLLLLTSERSEGQHIGAPAVRVFPSLAALVAARSRALREGVDDAISDVVHDYERRTAMHLRGKS